MTFKAHFPLLRTGKLIPSPRLKLALCFSRPLDVKLFYDR